MDPKGKRSSNEVWRSTEDWVFFFYISTLKRRAVERLSPLNNQFPFLLSNCQDQPWMGR